MLLFRKLSRLKYGTVLILMISTAHLISVRSHVCMLVKRPDPSRGGTLRWSMPKDDVCYCQGVVAPNAGLACHGRDEYEPDELWFVDDARPLTRRSNWKKYILDDLLQRTVFCANECLLKTDDCDINAVCADIPGSYTCTCNAGYAGDEVICSDNEHPEFEICPLGETASTDPGQPTARVVWDTPRARDNSGIVGIYCNYKEGSSFPIGDTMVQCTAYDESGNTKDCHFTVSVEDNEKPELESCPSSITIDTDPALPTAVVTWTKPEARDNSGKVSVSCSHDAGSNFNIGDTVVECSAVDKSGNEVECSFTVSVQDLDECMTNNHNCSANAICTNKNGGYNCSCDQGYVGDGFECVDVDECMTKSHNCSANSTCVNTDGGYNCSCYYGYEGDGFQCVAHCSGGWQISPERSCFFFAHDLRETFQQARVHCQKMGAELASIHSQSEQEFIGQQTKDQGDDDWWGYWNGYNDMNIEGQYEWSDGTQDVFENWTPTQPNGHSGDNCVVVSPVVNGLWWDRPCYNMYPYICKKP